MAEFLELGNGVYSFSDFDISNLAKSFDSAAVEIAEEYIREHPSVTDDPHGRDKVIAAARAMLSGSQKVLMDGLTGQDMIGKVKQVVANADEATRRSKISAARGGIQDSNVRREIKQIADFVSSRSNGALKLVYGLQTDYVGGVPNVKLKLGIVPTGTKKVETQRVLMEEPIVELDFSKDLLSTPGKNGSRVGNNSYVGIGADDNIHLYSGNQMKLRGVKHAMTKKNSYVLEQIGRYGTALDQGQMEASLREIRHGMARAASVPQATPTKDDLAEEAKQRHGAHKGMHTLSAAAVESFYTLGYELIDWISERNRRPQGSKPIRFNHETRQRETERFVADYVTKIMSLRPEQRKGAMAGFAKDLGRRLGISNADIALMTKMLESYVPTGSMANANDNVIRTGRFQELAASVYDPLGLTNRTERAAYQQQNFAPTRKVVSRNKSKVLGPGFDTTSMAAGRSRENGVYATSMFATSQDIYDFLTAPKSKGGLGLSKKQMMYFGGLGEGGAIVREDLTQDEYVDTSVMELTLEQIKEAQSYYKKNGELHKRKKQISREEAIRQLVKSINPNIKGAEDYTVSDVEGGGASISYSTPYHLGVGSKFLAQVPQGRQTVSDIWTKDRFQKFIGFMRGRGYDISDEMAANVNHISSYNPEAGMGDIGFLANGLLSATHQFLVESGTSKKPISDATGSLKLFKSSLKKQLVAGGLTDEQAQKVIDLYKIDKETLQIVPVNSTRFTDLISGFAKENKKNGKSEEMSNAHSLSIIVSKYLLAGIGSYAADAHMTSKAGFEINGEGQLVWHPEALLGYGQMGAIDQALQDPREHGGGSGILEGSRTVQSMLGSASRAEAATGKSYELFKRGIRSLKGHSALSDGQKLDRFANFSDTMTAFNEGINVNDPRYKQILRSVWGQDFELKREGGKITRESLEKSPIGQILAMLGDDQRGYLDVNGRYVPLPDMHGLTYEMQNGVEVLAGNVEWLDPLAKLLHSLAKSPNPNDNAYNWAVDDYQQEWSKNLFWKESALFSDTSKYYGGPKGYLKVANLIQEIFKGNDGKADSTMAMLKNAAIMNQSDFTSLLSTVDTTKGDTYENRIALLKEMLAKQMEGVSSEAAQQQYQDLLASIEGGTLGGKGAVGALAKMIARTGNMRDTTFGNPNGIVGLDILRYPENLGMLKQFSRLFVSGKGDFASGILKLGPALQEWEHADFDGDKMVVGLEAAVSALHLSKEELEQFFAELNEINTFMEGARERVGEVKIADITGDSQAAMEARKNGGVVINDNDLGYLADKQSNIEYEITALMKANKARTGLTSNLNFNWEHYRQQAIDYKSDMTEDELATAIGGDLLNFLTSNVPQYGISSKKIFRNLGSNPQYLTKSGRLSKNFKTDLASFYDLYTNPEVWNDDKQRDAMIDLGVKLGVFGGKPMKGEVLDEKRTGAMFSGQILKILGGRADQAIAAGTLAEDDRDQWIESILMKTFGLKDNEEGHTWVQGFIKGEQGLNAAAIKHVLTSLNAGVKGYGGILTEMGETYDVKNGLGDIFDSRRHFTKGSLAETQRIQREETAGENDANLMNRGGGGGPELLKAAEMLQEAAKYLMSLGGIGGGGKGGWRPYSEIAADIVNAQRNGRHPLGVTTFTKFISPFTGDNFDTRDFKRQLLSGAFGEDGYMGFGSDMYNKVRASYLRSERGHVGGVLNQMYNMAEGEDKAGWADFSQADAMFKKLYEAGPEGNPLYQFAFGDLEKVVKLSEKLGFTGVTMDSFFTDYDKALSNLVSQLQGIDRSTLKGKTSTTYNDLQRLLDRNGGYLMYASGMASMRAALTKNPTAVSARDNPFNALVGMTKAQAALSDERYAGMQYLGAESHIAGMVGDHYLHGFLDNLMYNPETQRLVGADNKNLGGSFSVENVAQQIMYKYLGEQMMNIIQREGKDKSFKEFKKEHGDLVDAWGLTGKTYNAFKKAKGFDTHLSVAGPNGERQLVEITASGEVLQQAVNGISNTFEDLTTGTKSFGEALKMLASILTKDGLLKGLDPATLKARLEEEKRERIAGLIESGEVGDTKSYNEYKSLSRQRSALLTQMMGDQRRSDLSYFPREKAEIEELNDQRAEEVRLIQEKMTAIRESGDVNTEELDKFDAEQQRRLARSEQLINTKNKGATNLWENLGNQVKSIFYRFTQMGAVYRILGKIRQGIAKVVQAAQQLDKVMTNLRIVTGYNAEDAQKLMNGYSDLAKTLSSTTAEVATAAQEWLRQGYEVAQVNDLVTSSIQLSVLGMMSASEATKALTSAMKGFKMETNEVSTIVDKFTALDMKAATSAGDIATALSKFATTAQMAGLDIDQASAMATTIMDVSQSDAGSTGNAIKTILSRYGNVKSGVYSRMNATDSDDTTEKINDIERVLSVIGVRIRDSAHEMRDFDDVLADVAAKWDSLDKVSQNAIATALAGTRQREAFAVLMNNYDKYQELLDVSQNSEGTAIKKYQSYTEQLEASQKRLQTAWERLTQDAAVSSFLKTVNNVLAFAVEKLPIIIRYLTRLIAITNAHKMPQIFSMFNPFGSGNKGAVGGFLRGLTPGGWGKKMAQYDATQGNMRVGLFERAMERVTGKFSNTMEKTIGDLDAFGAALRRNRKGAKGDGGTGTPTGKGGTGSKTPTETPIPEEGPTLSEAEQRIAARREIYKAKKQQARLAAQRRRQTTPHLAMTKKGLRMIGGTPADLSPRDGGTLTEEQAKLAEQQAKQEAEQAKKEYKTQLKRDKKAAKKARKEREKANKPSAGQRAMSAAAGAISGAMTATQTGFDYNTGQEYQLSKGAGMTSRMLTGVATGVGSIWGPAVGMLAGTAMDLLTKYVIMPLADSTYLARQKRMQDAQNTLNTVQELGSYTQNLSDLAGKEFSKENYEAQQQNANAILSKMYTDDNKRTRRLLESQLTQVLTGQRKSLNEQVSLNDVMNEYLEGNAETQKRIAIALEIAEARTATAAKYDTMEEKRKNLQDKLDHKSLGETWGAATGMIGGGLTGGLAGLAIGGPIGLLVGAIVGQAVGATSDYVTANKEGTDSNLAAYNQNAINLGELYKEAGFGDAVQTKSSDHGMGGWGDFLEGVMRVASLGFAASEETYLDTSSMSLEEQIEKFTNLRGIALARAGEDDRYVQLISSTEDILAELKDIKAQQEQIYKEMNATYIKAAFLSASIGEDAAGNTRYLTSATTRELKSMGIEEIRKVIAEELVKNGGLIGHETYSSTGELTEYAKKQIDAYLKTTDISSIVTGAAYTIREAAQMPEGEVKDQLVETISNALNMSEAEVRAQLQDKTSALYQDFGDLTVGFLTETTAETRTHITELTSLFDALTSSMGLTAENLETIIEKMPGLLKYLGDEEGMAAAMIKDLDTYKKSYAVKTAKSILSTEGVFDDFDAELRDAIGEDAYAALIKGDTEAGKIYGSATKLSDILTLMTGNPEDIGISPETQKAIREQYEKLFEGIDTDKIVDQKIAQTMISYQTKVYEKQIKNLNEQKQALQDINKQREYENKLIEARNKLEAAGKEKKRIWREGVGWVYEADQGAIEEAQKNLEDVQNEKKIDDLQLAIDYLEGEKTFLEEIASKEEFENLEAAYKAWVESNEDVLTSQTAIMDKIREMYTGEKYDESGNQITKGSDEGQTGVAAAATQAVSKSAEDKADAEAAGVELGAKYDALVAAKAALDAADPGSEDYKDYQKAYDEALLEYKTTAEKAVGSKSYTDFFTPDEDADEETKKRASSAKTALSWEESKDKILKYNVARGGDLGTLTVDLTKTLPSATEANIKTDWANDDQSGRQPGFWLNLKGGETHWASRHLINHDSFNNDFGGSLSSWMEAQPGGAEGYLLFGGDDDIGYVHGHQLHPVSIGEREEAAQGSLGLSGGLSLVNEEGTEAIITPQGTLTALPSGTGVVPADITRNLWNLGEVAPGLLRYLDGNVVNPAYDAGSVGSTDESFNIGVFNMNVTPNGDFDIEAWVKQVKQAVAAKRGSR